MRTNKTPFSDVCELITFERVEDADGYETETEVKTEVFCSVTKGVTRNEFYKAHQANFQLSITIEVWEDDFNDAERLLFEGKQYKIIRPFPSGHGTIEMVCEEVKR